MTRWIHVEPSSAVEVQERARKLELIDAWWVEFTSRVADVLGRGGVNPRTWILFFDDVLSGEWIGLPPDTPPPPRMGDGGTQVTMANRIRADAGDSASRRSC
jgi:hypothetical protein